MFGSTVSVKNLKVGLKKKFLRSRIKYTVLSTATPHRDTTVQLTNTVLMGPKARKNLTMWLIRGGANLQQYIKHHTYTDPASNELWVESSGVWGECIHGEYLSSSRVWLPLHTLGVYSTPVLLHCTPLHCIALSPNILIWVQLANTLFAATQTL